MLEQSYYDKADEIIGTYGPNPASLIPIMQDIQAEYRYLPAELLTYVAGKIGVTKAKAYSVATFYENFSFEAKGKYVIKVCDGTACHVKKSMPVLEALYKKLGLSPEKHTTDDMMFTVETVSCLGKTRRANREISSNAFTVFVKSEISKIISIHKYLLYFK